MNDEAIGVFTDYFGAPENLYLAMLALVLVLLGITIMIIAIKAMKDRRTNRDFDDTDVFGVLLRGLMVMLIVTALFAV